MTTLEAVRKDMSAHGGTGWTERTEDCYGVNADGSKTLIANVTHLDLDHGVTLTFITNTGAFLTAVSWRKD